MLAWLLPSLFWALATCFAVDCVRLNWEDRDRRGYCRCFTRWRTVAERLGVVRRLAGVMVDIPCPLTISALMGALGQMLGALLLPRAAPGRRYFRLPLDVWIMDVLDERQTAFGCVLGLDRMVDMDGVKVCPEAVAPQHEHPKWLW